MIRMGGVLLPSDCRKLYLRVNISEIRHGGDLPQRGQMANLSLVTQRLSLSCRCIVNVRLDWT